MAHLTNGSVTYERKVKTGDYEHKFAQVTIHYALDEGESHDAADQLLAVAGSLATGHVYQILRAKPPAPVADVLRGHPIPPTTEADVIAAAVIEPVVPVVVPDEILPPPVTSLKAAKRAVKEKVTEAVVIGDPTPASVVSPVEIVPSTTALAIEGPIVPSVTFSSPVPTVTEGEIVDDFTASAPIPTDAELGQALSRINAKLKSRPKIQALIGEFVQAGQSYTMIPDVRRGEFVARLEALV